MDYTDALKYHVEKGADVTVLYAHGTKAVGTEGENDTFLISREELAAHIALIAPAAYPIVIAKNVVI